MKYLRILNEQDLLFYDIETARAAESLDKLNPILQEAWRYKARHQNEIEKKTGNQTTAEDYFNEKAALYAPFARIVCIVAGRINGDTLGVKSYSGDEKKILTEFGQDLSQFKLKRSSGVLVGFNSIGFDSPFVSKRMLVNNVILPELIDQAHLKPWETEAVDLSKLWQGSSFYPDSLGAVAATLSLPFPKGQMDGAEVGNAFYKGKIEEIVKYCTGDVLTTANIFRRFLQKNLVTLAQPL